MTLEDEIALVADVLADEPGAAHRLWAHVGATVCQVAARSSRWNRSGEDQSSSVWLHLSKNNWRVLAAWNKSGPLLGFVFTIATNNLIDQHRFTVTRMGERKSTTGSPCGTPSRAMSARASMLAS
jgi:DNA-directed RNA polymerase specialized sigma24 family protein